ncbi:MAG: FtsW/RodA/SpoVE family cell cycle protein, partial [Alphaproteobacteria bacterium]
MARVGTFGTAEITLRHKLLHLNWGLLLLITATASIGFAMLYSAANGDLDPWASRQMVRFGLGVFLMLVAALIDIRFWLRMSYAIYGVSLALLVAVEVAGSIGMGAQRWIDLGFIQLQPSEVMKIALIMALARWFHGVEAEHVSKPRSLAMPLLLILLPTALVMKQPDLGTAMVLLACGGVIFWLVGVRMWMFAAVVAAGAAAVPVAWQFLHSYQKNRILTFLNPENDPLGAGYHILQSKIALGSGGVFGKGFLAGTQSHLNFLPEKQTDFIFTMLAEEFGLTGGLALLGLYGLVLVYGFSIAIR